MNRNVLIIFYFQCNLSTDPENQSSSQNNINTDSATPNTESDQILQLQILLTTFQDEKEHYEISRVVGQERLFDVIEAHPADVELVAVGTSCRHQIADFTGRKARHWAEVLLEALN